MDNIYEGDTGPCSRESIGNFLDEGLGTSLDVDGTDEISSSIHSTLGRNDSGVFDEMTTTSPPISSQGTNSISVDSSLKSVNNNNNNHHKKKNSSPNRHSGPQRCAICGKIFSNASALTKHKLTHSDERKHACSVCGKAFKRQDHLNGHMLTHRRQKPFECRAKGCGKSYCDGRSLRRHIESRHGAEALATLTIQATSSTNPSKIVTTPTPNNVTTNGSDVQIVQGVGNGILSINSSGETDRSHSHIMVVGSSDENGLVMKTDVVNFPNNNNPQQQQEHILTLDSNLNLLEHGTSMDFQVALPPSSSSPSVIVQDEKHSGSSKIESIHVAKTGGLTTTVSSGGTGVAVATVPVTIRTSHSQLHQLLTQRANAGFGIANLNASLVTINPGSLSASFNPHHDSVTTYAPSNWTTTSTDHHEIQMTKMSDDRTNDGVGVSPMGRNCGPTTTTLPVTTGGNGKSPSIPISASSSCSPSDMDMTLTPPTTTTTSGGGGTTTTASPTLLKEQLELIHQIIQQAQEESNLTAAAANSNTSKSTCGKSTSKGSNKKTKNQGGVSGNCSLGGNGIVVKIEAGEESIKSSGPSDDKPVECTICCRRFKNIPALNGHMRLHGGYFKKDADGKRKDVISSSKESSSTPLQTASVSVRALIEEKIIQKRNTQSQSQGIEKALVAAGSLHQNQVTPADSQIVFSESQSEIQNESLNVGLGLTDSLSTSSTVSSTFNVSTSSQPSQNLRFVYGDDNTDYLLMDEEVLNKCYVSDFLCQVSSICPDSFLNAIDESILNNSGNDQFPPEWNWATTSLGTDSDQHFVKLQSSSESPVTPLPPLDPALYASPTPQSPSVNSQDSPSFMYPIQDMSNVIVALTPPASLESHNLQSPLFPFPAPASQSTSQIATVVLPYETQANNYNTTSIDNSLVPPGPASADLLDGSTILNPVNLNLNNFSSLITTTIPGISSSVILVDDGSVNVDGSSTRTGTTTTTTTGKGTECSGGDQLDGRQFFSVQRENTIKKKTTSGGGTTIISEILTPSNSPSLANANMEDPVLQSVKELKVNEPSRMDCAGGSGVFLNPNSIPSSPCLKSSPAKRKQVRNTFASNLRPQTTTSSCKSQSQFTPYPILSPVRSAPGLFWTFSTKLSHVDDSKKEAPRINIGPNFQAVLPEFSLKKTKDFMEEDWEEENRLWNPDCLEFCSPEDVQNYLDLACSSAIPGGGGNKEYALHILSHCKGDINTAIFLLINPNPSLPNNLKKYKYQETKKWCREEINIFQEALVRYGKDFVQVAKEIEGKSTKECVIFYQLWKKVCSTEYEKVRAVCKKRDASFTLELLKNVPPPLSHSLSSTNTLHTKNNSSPTLSGSFESTTNVPNQTIAVTIPLGDTSGHNYPCKVCSKIFSKVKSRSAHMKSHAGNLKSQRKPETSDGNISNSKNTCNKKVKATNKAKNPVPPTSLTTTMTPNKSNSKTTINSSIENCSSWTCPPSSFSQGPVMTCSSSPQQSPCPSTLVQPVTVSDSIKTPVTTARITTTNTPVLAQQLQTGTFKTISNSGYGCDSNSSSQIPVKNLSTSPVNSDTTSASSNTKDT